jgi:glycosyltransferase involved in cell wall biosynthesis
MSRATRSIDVFIGPSLFTIRKHRELGIRGTMVQLPLFHPVPEGGSTPVGATNEGRPYFLFAGRLEKIKGVQTIIPIFRKLSNVDLLIAGDGKYRGQLERLARGAENIKFLGRVDHTQLHAAYRDAIATLIPSLCYETFGVVAIESFSAGTPVVVYAQSALEEIVRTHGGGILYRTEDEAKQAIQRLLSDRDYRDQLASEGMTAYESEFAEEPFMRNYLAVVRELLARKETGNLDRANGSEGLLAGRRVFY